MFLVNNKNTRKTCKICLKLTIKTLQSWANDCRQIHDASKMCFTMDCFTADFSQFLAQMSKFAFWVVGWVLAINPSISGISLEFPNFLRA